MHTGDVRIQGCGFWFAKNQQLMRATLGSSLTGTFALIKWNGLEQCGFQASPQPVEALWDIQRGHCLRTLGLASRRSCAVLGTLAGSSAGLSLFAPRKARFERCADGGRFATHS